MTLQRLRRLQRLEQRRRPAAVPFVDPVDTCMRLMVDLEAVSAGRAEWIPIYGPFLPDEAFDRAVRESDRMHERLTADTPL
jgi:hypothetical protein